MIFRDNSWFVKYLDCKIPKGERYCDKIIFTPIHPDNLNLINEYSRVFDNINARILAYPYVEFEIVEIENKEYANVKNI